MLYTSSHPSTQSHTALQLAVYRRKKPTIFFFFFNFLICSFVHVFLSKWKKFPSLKTKMIIITFQMLSMTHTPFFPSLPGLSTSILYTFCLTIRTIQICSLIPLFSSSLFSMKKPCKMRSLSVFKIFPFFYSILVQDKKKSCSCLVPR